MAQSDDTRDFQVYCGLLLRRSNLFQKLLAGPLKDRDTHRLPQVNAKVFQSFYDWMFSDELVGEDDAGLTRDNYIELYVFADLYMVQRLKDLALGHYLLRDITDWRVDWGHLSVLYKRTSQTSSLRRLHVDLPLETFSFKEIHDHIDDLPKDFSGTLWKLVGTDRLFWAAVMGRISREGSVGG